MAVHRSTHAGCAGKSSALCAAGHRYVKVKGDLPRRGRMQGVQPTKRILCQPGEDCDSNYNVETEKGEDYDCKPNLWSGCYFLWPIADLLLSCDSAGEQTDRGRK